MRIAIKRNLTNEYLHISISVGGKISESEPQQPR